MEFGIWLLERLVVRVYVLLVMMIYNMCFHIDMCKQVLLYIPIVYIIAADVYIDTCQQVLPHLYTMPDCHV